MRNIFATFFMIGHVCYNPINSGAVQLTSQNIDDVLSKNEFVFINFYADWCRFSQMLAPIWDEAADKAVEKYGHNGRVVFGKVDCEAESTLGTRFHITKYPTMKYVRDGEVAKREYRGQRSADSFVKFVEDQIVDPIKEFKSLEELTNMDATKRYLIGYFEGSKESVEYLNYRKLAAKLKDDCIVYVGFGEASKAMHPPGQSIVAFRPSKATSSDNDATFTGQLTNFDDFASWAVEKCTPLVRQITFENAEELTEEGLPFLILFHNPNDTDSVRRYTDVVKRELLDHKATANFLVADGVQFAHPLHHLGKSKEDLPLIAIDSFRHMYLFPDINDMEKPKKLDQFLRDLYNGKLHREFHYGPDPVTSSSDSPETEQENEIKVNRLPPDSPPESQFQHLGPSKNRYTLVHDEF